MGTHNHVQAVQQCETNFLSRQVDHCFLIYMCDLPAYLVTTRDLYIVQIRVKADRRPVATTIGCLPSSLPHLLESTIVSEF